MVIGRAVPLLHDLQPRCHFTPFETELFLQFPAGDVLDDIQNAFLGNDPGRDLLVAMLLTLGHKIKRRDGGPEALVVHGTKPVFDIIYVTEFSHETRIADWDSATQIHIPNQGRATCPASMTM